MPQPNQDSRTIDELREYQDLINRATVEVSKIFSDKLSEIGYFSAEKFKALGPRYNQTLLAYQDLLGEESKQISDHDEVKKCFRAIAILTHPDKTKDLTEKEQVRLEGVFKMANEAYDNGDLASLQMFLLVVGDDLSKQAEHFQKISCKVLDQLADKAADLLQLAYQIHKMPLHEFYILVEDLILKMEASIAKRSQNPLVRFTLPEPVSETE